ncbi:MAG: hemerythrin domain-containing protein [Rhizobiaceae bacterium]
MAKNEPHGGAKTLGDLHRDHKTFAELLDVFARELDVLDVGGMPDLELIDGIARYFADYANGHHHPKENLIYGHLICHRPTYGEEVFQLLKEHEQMARAMAELMVVLEAFSRVDPSSRRKLSEEGRAFLNRERDHMRREEEKFFPAAEGCLIDSQWDEVERDQRQSFLRLTAGRDFSEAIRRIRQRALTPTRT